MDGWMDEQRYKRNNWNFFPGFENYPDIVSSWKSEKRLITADLCVIKPNSYLTLLQKYTFQFLTSDNRYRTEILVSHQRNEEQHTRRAPWSFLRRSLQTTPPEPGSGCWLLWSTGWLSQLRSCHSRASPCRRESCCTQSQRKQIFHTAPQAARRWWLGASCGTSSAAPGLDEASWRLVSVGSCPLAVSEGLLSP